MRKKTVFLMLLFLSMALGGFASAEETAPTISISPENYFAGEETLYLQGRAEPNAKVFIFLRDIDGKETKKWIVQSNSNGDWSLMSKDLVKAGEYEFFAGSQKGEEMFFSKGKSIEIFLNGIVIFGLATSFKNLIYILAAILAVAAVFFGTVIFKIEKAKKRMRKEVKEARDICGIVFENLQEKIKKRIELIDSQPGFNIEEKKAFDDLNKFLNAACSSIEKEILDVEKLIK